MSGTTACCSVARDLPAKRLANLNEELRNPDHRSFAKLSAAYGVARSSVEKHKKVCMRLGVAKPHFDPRSIAPPAPTPVRVDVQKTSMDGVQNSVDVQDRMPPARAPVSSNDAESRPERVALIVQKIVHGRPGEKGFEPMRDVPLLAKEWGLAEATVREYVRAAEDVLRINAGDVEAAKVQSVVFLTKLRDAAFDAQDYRSAREAQAEINRVTGAVDDSTKVQVNIVQHPAYIATMQAILEALRPFPDARAKVVRAVQERLTLLGHASKGTPILTEGVSV